MSKHSGSHRCGDPRCGGFDRKRIYNRIKKTGAQAISVFDERMPYVYTVGLFANKMLPELLMRVPDLAAGEEGSIALRLFSVADYLSTLPSVEAGTTVPAAVLGQTLWLWGDDERNRIRPFMGIGRDYYRDIHLRRLDDVPAYFLSLKPHPEAKHEIPMNFAAPLPGGIVASIISMTGAT